MLYCPKAREMLYLVINNYDNDNNNNVIVNIFQGFLYDLFYKGYPFKSSQQTVM